MVETPVEISLDLEIFLKRSAGCDCDIAVITDDLNIFMRSLDDGFKQVASQIVETNLLAAQ